MAGIGIDAKRAPVTGNGVTDDVLIARARSAAIAFSPSDACSVGAVGAAIETTDGAVFTGLCIDLPSGMGFCAEHAAAAEMLKSRRSRIACVVAVTAQGAILPPCGRCREFLLKMDPTNRDAEVVVSVGKRVRLGGLLPLSPE